jgi:hypothetical protein
MTYGQVKYRERRDSGLCVDCGHVRAPSGLRCDMHAAAHRSRAAAAKEAAREARMREHGVDTDALAALSALVHGG